jgi:hypothetical protein
MSTSMPREPRLSSALTFLRLKTLRSAVSPWRMINSQIFNVFFSGKNVLCIRNKNNAFSNKGFVLAYS